MSLKIRSIGKEFVDKEFGVLRVLDGVDIEVRRGEFIVIVGPNGCGKTTLLRIVIGALKADLGTIEFCEELTSSPSPFGVVFQKPLLLPWLNAEENIVFPLRFRTNGNCSALKDRLQGLLDLAELGKSRAKYPTKLSGGEKQKVAILRALVTDPSVLVMDEPFSALDDEAREDLQNYLLKICEGTQRTVLFVTHDLDEAVLLADTVIVLSRKPTKVQVSIPITIPKPRRLERKLQNEAAFEALVSDIRKALRHAR